MATQNGVAIVIKAWLPTGKTFDEQYDALSKVKAAHASGDYAALLASATIEDVKTETKTRRGMEAAPAAGNEDGGDPQPEFPEVGEQPEAAPMPAESEDDPVPEFLRGTEPRRRRAAAE